MTYHCNYIYKWRGCTVDWIRELMVNFATNLFRSSLSYIRTTTSLDLEIYSDTIHNDMQFDCLFQFHWPHGIGFDQAFRVQRRNYLNTHLQRCINCSVIVYRARCFFHRNGKMIFNVSLIRVINISYGNRLVFHVDAKTSKLTITSILFVSLSDWSICSSFLFSFFFSSFLSPWQFKLHTFFSLGLCRL